MRINMKILLLISLTIFCLSTNITTAQAFDWKYIETEHFNLIFHPEVERQTYRVAEIAEEVYGQLKEFTGFKAFRKIAIVISTQDDIANGEATPRDLIFLSANPLITSTRVDREWLKNLITHELTHILQTETTFGVTYSLHKITGAPTVLGLPPNALQPRWFLEGVAQYGSYMEGYDFLDRKREMIFEQKVQTEDFYPNSEIIWGRSEIGGEIMYNYGFGFIEFLMRKYGEDKFIEIQQMQNSFYYLGLDAIMSMVYNKPLSVLVAEWKRELNQRFPIRIDRDIAQVLLPKPELAEWNEPLVTPDGGVIFTEKHINKSSIKINYWHPDTGLTTLLDSPKLAFTRLALSPDGQKLLYTSYDSIKGAIRWDLNEMNLQTGVTTRLTTNGRIVQGIYYYKGYLVIKNDWGKLHLYYLQDGQMTQLTDTDYNFVITDLAISPDQKRLAINFNYNGQRGIGIMRTDSWEYEKIYYPGEENDWLLGDFIDNNSLTLSWDRLDHYDLYALEIRTGKVTRITNTREDILQGQIQTFNEQQYWYGQTYGSAGFTIAKGPIAAQENIIIKSHDTNFQDAVDSTSKPVKSGDYNHLAQLRSDLFSPYVDTEDEFEIGVSQYLSDPLEELSIYYDLKWNVDREEMTLNLDTDWKGTNPGLSLSIQSQGWDIAAGLTETYEFYPYSLSASQIFQISDGFQFNQLQLQLARSWIQRDSAATLIQANYYPAKGIEDPGYDVSVQHNQQFSIGYQGDSLTSQSIIGYAGGSNRFTWGEDDLFWVYPEKSQAQRMAIQKLHYQHNLADLSSSLTIFDTGRLYTNIFGEIGLFCNNEELTVANMAGIGFELETRMLNLMSVNYELVGAINSNGDVQIKYSLKSPF